MRLINNDPIIQLRYICWNVDTKAKRPQKMNTIARISVCDICRIDLIKIEIT